MKSLVGSTGFVGSNLREGGDFDALYNSKNIADAFGTSPDLLVYAGARAEMFLANAFPEKDFAQMRDALGNIKNIQPKKLVLISTISVYGENPAGDEDTAIDENTLTAYGRNRLWLENAARGECADALIVRLPALYGKNLKKNFIYDYIHVIPSLLKEEKFRELAAAGGSLDDFYERQGNGFYQCRKLMPEERRELAGFFKGCGFPRSTLRTAAHATSSTTCAFCGSTFAPRWTMASKRSILRRNLFASASCTSSCRAYRL